MSIEELQKGIETAWKHTYSFRSIARRIRHSPAPWPVKLGTNLGYRFYAAQLEPVLQLRLDHRAGGFPAVQPGRSRQRKWPHR